MSTHQPMSPAFEMERRQAIDDGRVSEDQLGAVEQLLRSINAETADETAATALIGRWGDRLCASARTLREEARR